jgi:hypothetical protein
MEATKLCQIVRSSIRILRLSARVNVSVPGEFLDHSETKDRRFHRVMKDMKPDQPRVQITVSGDIACFHSGQWM